jgi:methyl-accepting chemotaxis protein
VRQAQGFAVVADEVRNLAMRAADAAKNTATLIEGTVKKVKEGSDLVGITEKEFHDLAASVEKSAGLVGEISAASTEQAQGIEQINKAVNEMDKVVQQNAANAEESASASEEMSAQAYQIKDFVGELKTMVDGSKGGRSANKEKSVKNRMEMAAVSGKKSGSHAPNIAQKALPPSGVKKSQAEKLIPLEDTENADF